jgi:hypothetical protein
MLRNGSYSAWYRTRLREGTGVVVLHDGKITGGDASLAYTGTYFQNGDQFSAVVTTRRHTPGPPSVFGIDNLDLTLTGKSAPTTASLNKRRTSPLRPRLSVWQIDRDRLSTDAGIDVPRARDP